MSTGPLRFASSLLLVSALLLIIACSGSNEVSVFEELLSITCTGLRRMGWDVEGRALELRQLHPFMGGALCRPPGERVRGQWARPPQGTAGSSFFTSYLFRSESLSNQHTVVWSSQDPGFSGVQGSRP